MEWQFDGMWTVGRARHRRNAGFPFNRTRLAAYRLAKGSPPGLLAGRSLHTHHTFSMRSRSATADQPTGDLMLNFIQDILSGLGRWLRELVDAFSDLISEIIGTLRRFFRSDPPYRPYDTDEWCWDADCKRWILKTSETAPLKSYNCTEYTIGKLTPRAPLWGGSADTTTETEEIEQELTRNGFTAQANANGCGCVSGSAKPCAVVYSEQGMVVHAAVFDPNTCDWGGKLSANGPVARLRNPRTT